MEEAKEETDRGRLGRADGSSGGRRSRKQLLQLTDGAAYQVDPEMLVCVGGKGNEFSV